MKPRLLLSPRRLLMIALVSASTGCSLGERAAPSPGAARSVESEYSKDGKLLKLQSDRDHDGTIDTFGYMDGARVVRVEIDENNDGTIDRWEFHGTGAGSTVSGAPDTPDRTIERIERATRHDGIVNRREFFTDGQLSRVEEDTDGDGRVDKWETYSGGTLRLMAVDTSHRGSPDRRIVYGEDGAFLRVEADPSGTGTFTPLSQ